MAKTKYIELIPTMSSNTSTGVAIGSSIYLSNTLYDYFKAFDKNNSTAWVSNSVTSFLGYNFQKKTVGNAYSISCRNLDGNDLTSMIRDWTFEGSNDGINWDILDTQSNHSWVQSQKRTFYLANNAIYSQYRINITQNNGFSSASSIGEFQIIFSYTMSMAIKNPSTNKHYSLDNKTLIHLPSSSDKNMILHGIEAGKEIKLDEPFDKLRTVIDNEDGTQTVIDEIVTPFSVYDHISETPEVLVYTELNEDVTIETTAEPFGIYDEFGKEVEVLYYTDDGSVNEANLTIEANWSPIDELEGNFEIATWTDEEGEKVKRTLGITAIPKPQFIYPSTINKVKKLNDIILSDLSKLTAYSSNVKLLFTPNNNEWYYFNKNSFVKLTNITTENIKRYGHTISFLNTLTSTQLNTWNFDKVNVGIYLEDDVRGNIESKVSDINITNFTSNNTSIISNTSFYILNTTARIDIDLQGMSVFGILSDADMSRVQYRVKLNGQPYFPIDGEFTALAPSPQSISLNFTSDQIKIDDWNTVEVEFQDFFGTTDTWSTQFVGRYAGIVFTDENGELYSTDVGQVLKYLDFGTVLTGQVTPTYTVKLKNQYGFNVKEVNIQAHTSGFAEGLNLDFSLENDVNTFSDTLLIPSMKNEEEISFYLRMRSPITTEPNGHNLFDIFVSAKRDV